MSGHKKTILGFCAALMILAALSSVYAVLRPGETLRIGGMYSVGSLSPFFADTESDAEITGICFDRLAMIDRAGNLLHTSSASQQSAYQGVNYIYKGIADLKIDTDEENGLTKYTWTLADGIYFQDGEEADSDDIIFSYYVFLDPSYQGPNTVYSVPILGLEEYRTGSAEKIEGIRRTGSKSVEITVKSCDTQYAYPLAIPLCPLHYYGSEGKYDYENNLFGFTKGDLSGIKKKDSYPLGTGPYQPVFQDEKQLICKANPYYYGGEPTCPRLAFIPCSDVECAQAIQDNKIDIAFPTLSAQLRREIRDINTNGNLYGDKIRTVSYENENYGYIGINAGNVSVGGDRDSDSSRALRRAFALVFSYFANRRIPSYFGEDISIENISFLKKPDGSPVFSENDSLQAKRKAVKDAAVQYLKEAGFSFSYGRVIKAPESANLEYTVLIQGGGYQDHPCYETMEDSASLFKEIGITLKIKDLSSQQELWQAFDEGTVQIWCAAWESPDKYALYHSSSYTASRFFGISDSSLDKLLEKNAESDSIKKIVDSWAVEIPVYRRTENIVYSAERVSNLAHNPTQFHSWISEIASIEKR